MAPKKHKQARTPPKSRKASDSGALIASLKSTIQNTKAKLNALRASGTGKVAKSAAPNKTITERERLKQVIERLSDIEGRISSKDSSSRYSSKPSPHILTQELAAYTPQDLEVGDRIDTDVPITECRASCRQSSPRNASDCSSHVPLNELSTLTPHNFEIGGSLENHDPIVEGGASSKRSSPRQSSEPSLHQPLKEPSTLTPHDFEVGGTLGKGKFGRVFLARHLATNYICALKIISKAQCSNEEEERLIRREIEVHQNLAHKNILKLLSWFHDETNIYLVLEFAPGGSLYSRLRKTPKGRFDERTAANYVAQIADALRYMHSKNIIHRDIKPENILLGLHNEIKLADFGYSVHTESGFRSTVCGTLDYLSPEMAVLMLKPGKDKAFYTKAIDQWSLGVLMYELLVGRPPFEMKSAEKTQLRIARYKGKGIKFPAYVAQGAEDLIRKLLDTDAEKRLGFDEVLRHPWMVRQLERSVKSSGIRSFGHMLEKAT